jgi:hypothetical protein
MWMFSSGDVDAFVLKLQTIYRKLSKPIFSSFLFKTKNYPLKQKNLFLAYKNKAE